MAGKNRIEFDGKQRQVAVIAFGGNALLRPQDHGTQEEQFTLSWKATRWLVEIIHRGYELAIVHGNGPQVGNIMIQVEEAITKIPPQSLDVAVAQTQGSMGYMLANQLRNRFNEEQLEKEIAAVLTEVEVDRRPGFREPHETGGSLLHRLPRQFIDAGARLADGRGRRPRMAQGGAIADAATDPRL
jgi:carbamate kinase